MRMAKHTGCVCLNDAGELVRRRAMDVQIPLAPIRALGPFHLPLRPFNGAGSGEHCRRRCATEMEVMLSDWSVEIELALPRALWAVRCRRVARRVGKLACEAPFAEAGEAPARLMLSALFRNDPLYRAFYRLWQERADSVLRTNTLSVFKRVQHLVSRIGIHILSWGCAEEWPGAGARPCARALGGRRRVPGSVRN
jgi:hypothetical protein